MRLSPGDIYVSPLDLNIEHGIIEQPRKPMLRLAKRLFDRDGHSRGIVIVNYLALNLLEALANQHRSNIWLLNPDGYWLRGPDAADEWGFMFERPDLSLARRYPMVWARIIQERSGQFETANGIWSFDTVVPAVVMASDQGARPLQSGTDAWSGDTSLAGQGDAFWKVVKNVPRTEYSAELQASGYAMAVCCSDCWRSSLGRRIRCGAVSSARSRRTRRWRIAKPPRHRRPTRPRAPFWPT
jgi:two-component system, sensor histidine kinase and response regulator